jgi:hypothetical protein
MIAYCSSLEAGKSTTVENFSPTSTTYAVSIKIWALIIAQEVVNHQPKQQQQSTKTATP